MMEERIKAIEEYLKYFPNDSTAKNNLLLCQYADELDLTLNGSYYPRIDYKSCIVNNNIRTFKNYQLTNSATNYKQNKIDTLIIWSAECGRLQFVDEYYYWTIEDEWEEFINTLKSYNPVDYDEMNNVYIYNVENGKKLIKEYNIIKNDFEEKILKKINDAKLKEKKEQFERLKKELGGEIDNGNII